MSNMAIDAAGAPVYADRFRLSRKDEVFYCPNEECGATMQLIAPYATETGMVSSHFANRDAEHKHIAGCFVGEGFLANAMKYDVSNFSLETLLQIASKRSSAKTGYSHKNAFQGNIRNRAIKNVATAYYRFLSIDLDSIINGHRVGDMFACTRNQKQYEFRANGIVLMELKFKNYYYGTRGEENHLTMYCLFPRTKGEDDFPKTRWQLHFTSPDVLDEVEYQVHKMMHRGFCEKFSDAKKAGKDVIIAVLGHWEGRSCRIYSAKQIRVVRQGGLKPRDG